MRIKNKKYLMMLILPFAGVLLLSLPACGSKKKKKSGDPAPVAEIEEEEQNEATTTKPKPKPDEIANLTSSIGIRSFAELNATFAVLTGISAQDNERARTGYAEIKFSLPNEARDIRAFTGPQQIAVLKLAAIYCRELMNDGTENFKKRVEIFTEAGVTGVNLGLTPAEFYAAETFRKGLGRAFAKKFWVLSSASGDFKAAEDESAALIADFLAAQSAGGATAIPGDNGQQNISIVSGVCSAVLASFPVLAR